MNLSEEQRLAKSKICLPLDGLKSLNEVSVRVNELKEFVGLFKIGKESFTRFGPKVVEVVKSLGSEVFLDLKFHDIPNTVKGASNAACDLGVSMFNVHASGGSEMLKASVEGVNQIEGEKPKILGVTVLTSINEELMNEELKVVGSVEEQVLNLAKICEESGLDGIVCSGKDVKFLKNKLRKDFLFVTPGIKSPSNMIGSDQKRVYSPCDAIKDGASILVVGRAITGFQTSEERRNAALEILNDIVKELKEKS